MKYEEAIKNTEYILVRQQNRTKLFCVGGQKKSLYWFCKSYAIVTEKQLENIKNKKFHYPHFVSKVIVEFDDIFEKNLQTFLQHKKVSSVYWESVFNRLTQSSPKNSVYHFFYSWRILVMSLDVHIQKDLPICLASAIETCYAEKESIEFLRKDFLMMTSIFHHTAKAIELEILEEYNFPFIQFSNSFRTMLLKKYINYKVIKSREKSWQTAAFNFLYKQS